MRKLLFITAVAMQFLASAVFAQELPTLQLMDPPILTNSERG